MTVATQPAGQTCTVTNGSGTTTANVTNVAVACAAHPPTNRTIGGTVSGLAAGQSVVLQNNGGRQPHGQREPAVHVRARRSRTAPPMPSGADAARRPDLHGHERRRHRQRERHQRRGRVRDDRGRHGHGGRQRSAVLRPSQSVVLQNNGAGNLTVAAPGAFTFATPVATGAAYAVTVATQPVGQICTPIGGLGHGKRQRHDGGGRPAPRPNRLRRR